MTIDIVEEGLPYVPFDSLPEGMLFTCKDDKAELVYLKVDYSHYENNAVCLSQSCMATLLSGQMVRAFRTAKLVVSR